MSEFDPAPVLAKLESLGVKYTADFVPFSRSRNATSEDLSLNWRVTFSRDGRPPLSTDFVQGIGNVPMPLHLKGARRECIAAYDYFKAVAEHGPGGRELSFSPSPKSTIKQSPDVCSVLSCLLLDAQALDYGAFEPWCTEFGYDPDSRKAETIYRTCLGIGLQLRALIGDTAMTDLRELLQDY